MLVTLTVVNDSALERRHSNGTVIVKTYSQTQLSEIDTFFLRRVGKLPRIFFLYD